MHKSVSPKVTSFVNNGPGLITFNEFALLLKGLNLKDSYEFVGFLFKLEHLNGHLKDNLEKILDQQYVQVQMDKLFFVI